MLGDGSKRNLYELSYKELLEEGADVSVSHPNILVLRGLRVLFCEDCHVLHPPSYMLHNALWKQVTTKLQCFLCFKCVQVRLQRNLTIDDFTNALVNDEIRFGFRLGRAYKGE